MTEAPNKCPKCGKEPAVRKVRSNWKVLCLGHTLSLVEGHWMKSKRDAVSVWNQMTKEHHDQP